MLERGLRNTKKMAEDDKVEKDEECADQDNDIEPVKLEKPKKEKEELLVIGFEKKPKGKNPLAMRSPDSRRDSKQALVVRGSSK